jgi:DNA-binding transcriptional regulator YhcF (GntR family)
VLNQIIKLEKIQTALSSGNVLSIHELAKKTGLHYVTVKKYIKLIEIMEKMPKIEIIKSNSTTLVRLGNRENMFSR